MAPTPGAAVAGLAREVEALRRRLDQLSRCQHRVDQLADLLARHAEAVAATTSAPATPEPPSWLDLPTDPGRPAESSSAARAAEDLLTTLAGWVGGIYLRYPDAAQTLPECWLWHPEVVEELLWLHTAWLAAYRPGAASTAVGDWHDRQRPGVARRIRDYAGICSLEQHQPGAERHTPAPGRPAHRRGAGDRRLVGHPPRPTRRRHRPPSSSPRHAAATAPARPPMTTDTTERDPGWRTVWAAGLVVAAGAGIATAHGLYQVAAAARVPTPIGWLYPLITDGLALVAYAATARLHAGGRRYAAGIVILAAGLSGLAQAVYLAGGLDHTGPAPVGLRFGVGAWPAIAAALTAHLLHLIATGASTPAAAVMQRSPAERARVHRPNPPYNDAPYNAASDPGRTACTTASN